MKIIKPYYEILSDIPENGIWVLKELERDARTCYKSENKTTSDGESAKRLIKKLIDSGHEAMLEGYHIKVKFTCDRGVSHELVRHRLCSFAQESTRYCNYSNDKFGNEITVIEPIIFQDMSDRDKERLLKLVAVGKTDSNNLEFTTEQRRYVVWVGSCLDAEFFYMDLLDLNATPEIARAVLPNCLKTEINMMANLREWRHIFHLRTSERAHPEMRRLMIPLLKELHERIPIVFDDIWFKVAHNEGQEEK